MKIISFIKNSILLLLVLCFCIPLFAQKGSDSLIKAISGRSDQEKLDILLKKGGETLMVDPAKSIRFSEEALKIALSLNQNAQIAQAHHNIGVASSRIENFSNAIKHLNLAVEYYRVAGDDYLASLATNDIAGFNVSIKRFDVALNIYTQLLSYYFNKGMMERYCSIMNNVGTILNEKKEYDKALANYFKALEIKRKIAPNDRGFLAALYCNIGESYFGKGEYANSLKYRKMSLSLYETDKFVDGIANLQMDAASSYIKLRDFKNARLYLDSALQNYSSIKYPDGIRRTKKLFVELYIALDQTNKALTQCRELERLSVSYKDSTMLAQCFKFYSAIYTSINDYKLSAENARKFIDISENMEIKTNKLRIAEMQAVFETEEKEFENKTLRQENELQKEKLNSRGNLLLAVTLGVIVSVLFLIILMRKEKKIKKINEKIQEQNKRLEEHLISKDKFFSILAHNLKNPFWAVLGQNKMLEDEYDDLTEKERKELVKGIGSSAGNVYKLFEDLLKWAKSQQNAIEVEKSRLSLRDLIRSSIRPYELIAENKKIGLEINVREEIELEGDRFMLETVIGNLVDNAIKFSVQEESVIISGYRTEEGVELKVQDYGMGISQDKLDKLFKIDEDVTTAGTMNEKGTGLGLIICKEFIEKHGGRIKVESIVGRGTAFSIILPAR